MLLSRTRLTRIQHHRPVCRGFTLIEVLVVVAIIALLVSVLLPSLSAARVHAQAVACASNLRSCGMGMVYYLEANHDYYCGGNWASLIHKYVQKASKKASLPNFSPTGVGLVEWYLCPGDEIYHESSSVLVYQNGGWTRLTYALSYGMNDSLIYKIEPSMVDRLLDTDVPGVPDEATNYMDPGNVAITAADGRTDVIQTNMRQASSVKRPSSIVMMMDSGDDDTEVGTWYFEQDIHNTHNLQVHHKKGNNFLYADTHVEFKKVLKGAYQYGVPEWPWAWVPLEGWRVSRSGNLYNPYGQDYSEF